MKTTQHFRAVFGRLFFKKLALLIIVASSNLAFSQKDLLVTPEGVLDKVFDQRGTEYKLSDLMADKDGTLNRTVLMNCSSTSIFNLYFEDGCGMEITSNSVHNARRAVLCRVFQDLSDFITNTGAPLQPSSATKVNIWVRNINNVYTNPNGILGLGSGFYCLPSNAANGGIADNEIWKTIHTGSDSYLNLTVPLTPLGGGSNQSGFFYHGMVTFNFNDTAGPPVPPNTNPIVWNTNLSTTSIPTSQFDLYSVVLHEVTHALGFQSLINSSGNSTFSSNYRYFSRYDTFLRTSAGTPVLTPPSSTCSLYNQSLTSGLTSAIFGTTPTPCSDNNTTACGGIRFAGSWTPQIPVYNPSCFSPVSSLSHFEDMHYPSCNSNLPNGDNYFLMCNAGSSGIIRRYLRPEERSALCDIGYNVKNSYGVSGAFINGTATSFNYGGAASCGGITVAGVNDGIGALGAYTFVYNIGQPPLTINGNSILGNDIGATGGLVCLEDLTGSSTIPTTSGTTTTNFTFSSTLAGLHLLRYVPVTSGGQRGNITYVYVYAAPNVPNCTAPITGCNLVNNGNFESNNVNITQPADFAFTRVCNWERCNTFTSYLLQNTSTPQYSVPCNLYGSQNDKIAANRAYAEVLCYGAPTFGGGIIATRLQTPLSPNTTYQVKFDISLAEFFKYRNYQLQAFVSSLPPTSITGFSIPNAQLPNGVLLTNPTITTNTNGWDTAVLTFTTSATQTNLEYLYLGVLNAAQNSVGTAPSTVSGCANTFNFFPQNGSVYYLDNVSLIATGGASLDLPATICSNQSLSNLTTYIAAAPNNGIFSGTGVVLTNGVYSFNPLISGAGTFIVTYTYNSNLGCPVTLTDSIIVSNNAVVTPTFSFTTSICSGTAAPNLPPISVNGFTGTWSPTTVSNTASGNYVFTPTLGQCATTVTVPVTVNAYPVVTSFTPLNQTVCLNSPATPISVVAGTGVTYQWFRNSTNSTFGGSLLTGVTSSSFTPGTGSTVTRYYYVVISRNGCSTTSPVATVTVVAGTANPGTISGTLNLCKTGRSNPVTVLTASVAGGTWSSSNTSIASILSTTTLPTPSATIRVAPGTAIITYTVTGGTGCTSSVSVTVTTTIPVIPTFTQFPINPSTGISDTYIICAGATPVALPTTSSNGITGTWDIPTISNTVSQGYTFDPTPGQCASGFYQPVMVIQPNDFVATADSFTVGFPVTSIVTNSILTNDTFTGLPLNYVPANLNYTITLVGAPPVFPNGGITLNSNGTFMIQPNTTPGLYTFNYRITTACGVSNTATATVSVGNYVGHQGKVGFLFCYNQTGNQYNTSTLTGDTSLFSSGTVGGLPANSGNANIIATPPAGVVINADGTLTITSSLPQSWLFNYTICSLATGACSVTLVCNISINTTLRPIGDNITFYTNGAPPTSYNVLSNDSRLNCYTETPATTSNVSVSQVGTNPWFSISNTGQINANPAAPATLHTLYYTICDLAFPAICSPNVIVYINQSSSKMASTSGVLNGVKIAPNPSRDRFEIIFDTALLTNAHYSVYDVLGKKVFENTIDRGATTSTLNLENYSQGVYLLNITIGDAVINKTLLKE